MNARATTHGKAARAATTTHPAAGAGDACRRSPQGATGRAGDVPAAEIQRKAQSMKKTISAQWGLGDPDPRSADAAQVVEDAAWRDEGRDIEAAFVSASGDEATFSATDRNAEWAKLKQAAEAAAKRDGVNTRSRKAVGAYTEAAMREYAEAVRNGHGRELLPNTDWRTRAARRHGDKIVAALLYREAADAINAETARAAEEEAAWRERHEQQAAQEEAAIIDAYERREAKKRPGRYAHHGNGAGLDQKEAVEILSKYNKKISVRTLRRWETGKGTPKGYPGLSDRAQFVMWAALLDGQTRHGRIIQEALPYRETATEAANMRQTGRKTPRGIF